MPVVHHGPRVLEADQGHPMTVVAKRHCQSHPTRKASSLKMAEEGASDVEGAEEVDDVMLEVAVNFREVFDPKTVVTMTILVFFPWRRQSMSLNRFR